MNSLPDNTFILTSTGKFRQLKYLKPGQKVINNYGASVAIKDIRYAGLKKTYQLTSEAWHGKFNISDDHVFLKSSTFLELPNPEKIRWEFQRDNVLKYTYYTGYTIGFLLVSALVSKDAVVCLIKTAAQISKLKELNNCLASALCIKDIRLEEGSHTIEYIIHKASLPAIVLTALQSKDLPEALLNPYAKQYILGLSKGVDFALCNTVSVDDKLKTTRAHVNMLCDWLNLVRPSVDGNVKKVMYFAEPAEKSITWDILLEGKDDTYIANNIVCVSQSPS